MKTLAHVTQLLLEKRTCVAAGGEKNALSLAAAGENAPPLSRRGGVGDGDGVGGRRGRRITR